ncbi:hypothetical protein [Marinicella sp. W31]|uniref:hypothetical protein n=1 Tax=Marinicella sp. W31 TaxID=3023713 RepID=UPI00375686B6
MKFVVFFLFALFQQNYAYSADVPNSLKPWESWVQYQQEFRRCPYFYNEKAGQKNTHVCAWPQQLSIDINGNTAGFEINWDVQEDSWIPLPGDAYSWPQSVAVNSNPVAVQNKNGIPRIYLTPGKYNISGTFEWTKRPETIEIPSILSDIRLQLDDQLILFPERTAQQLWLGDNNDDQEQQSNSIEFQVNRLIIDGHPMTMIMSVDLFVSGTARTEKLGAINQQLFEITDIGGDLSAYMDDQGELWTQLKPGSWELNLTFNIKGWPEEIAFQPQGEFWPTQEIWAYQDNKNIRLTQIEGVTPINPEQVFSRWDQVPNFLLNAGDTFSINEQKRGTLNQSEQLSLYRQMWLAFDGNNYRSKDQISGAKLGSWRLNAQPGYQLLNANSHNETILITSSSEQQQGVELRRPQVDLQVNGEFPADQLNRISGWQTNFDDITTELFLPHGYMALATRNVDNSNNVWIEKWQLWDIFIVMLLTAFTFRFIGIKAATAAFFALVLGYHEFQMPLAAWGGVVFAAALLYLKLSGKILGLARTYAVISVVVLLFALIPFVIGQVRLSLYPQLSLQNAYFQDYGGSYAKAPAPVAKKKAQLDRVYSQTYNRANAIATPQQEAIPNDVMEQSMITVTGSRIRRSDMLNHYQTGAILQAGKGTPQWRFNAVRLQWDGPITAEQDFGLYLLTPVMRVIWRLLLVAASVLWFLMLLQSMLKRPTVAKKTTATSLFFCSLMLCFGCQVSAQQFPSDTLLNDLQKRLNKPEPCSLHCASLENATVEASNNQMQMVLNYHVLADVAIPLPYSKSWHVSEVSINGVVQAHRIRYKEQPWIAVKAGINRIQLTGVLANKNNISIMFPIDPGNIRTQSDDWQFAGLDGHVLNNDILQLIAATRNTDSAEESKTTNYQQFVKVKRSIVFDDQWRQVTRIERIAPLSGVINVAIPLMPNERPYDKLQRNTNGDVLVSLAPNQNSFSWKSVMERAPRIEWQAAQDASYLETWTFVSAPQWHVQIDGLPMITPTQSEYDPDDFFEHVYMPRPGESLVAEVSRPEAVAGDILSIESINTNFTVGKRTTKANTSISYRATQGGSFQVNLDPAAEVKKVSYDGVDSNLVNEDGLVDIGFLPGTHKVDIEWHMNSALSSLHQTPLIRLDKDYSNLTQTIRVPRNRWLLWGTSTGVGPAFLYWGELVIFSIIAFFLARLPYSPLKFWQWLILGYAFGTFSWMALTVLSVWLFYLNWKKQFNGFEAHHKNVLLQWGTIFFSFVSVVVLIGAVAFGLLSYPDMGISGQNASGSQLQWFVDSGAGEIPTISVLSLPLWVYKGLILLWSIWISFAAIKWLKMLISGLDKDHWWFRFKRKNKSEKPAEE